MNELIAIAVTDLNGETVPTVNARDLHRFLQVGKDFSTWIKAQIDRGRLVEGRDYVTFQVSPKKGENPSGGRPATEYALTLDAGKHIAMMSGTEKGFEVREYFIACEKRAKASVSNIYDTLSDPARMRVFLLNYVEKVISLEAKVEEMRPDVLAFERIAKADGFLNITEAAKALGVPRNRLFKWLHANGWIYRRAGAKNWLGYDTRVRAGLLDHKATIIPRPDGTDKVAEQVVVTPKGLTRLAKEIGTPPPDLALAL